MKNKFTLLLSALALMACLAPSAWGGVKLSDNQRVTQKQHETTLGGPEEGMTREDEVAYTLTPANGTNNSYDKNCDIEIEGITWNLTGNSQMLPWRIGGKSITNTDRTLYSKTAISDNITKIEVTHGAASGITINSWTVIVASDADFTNVVSTLTPTFNASSTTTINRPDGVDWSNCYYKFVYNVTVSGSTNKFLEFTKAEFYKYKDGGSQPTTYTVTYKAGEGTGSDVTETKTEGVAYTIADVPSSFTAPQGKSFDGWLGNDNNTYAVGDTYTIDAALTLTAQWTENTTPGGDATTTYTFTTKDWKATPANWTSGKDGNQFTNNRGVQVTANTSGANATSPISFTNVSQIVVTYSTNTSAGAGSIAFQVGSNTEVSQSVTTDDGTNDRTLTYSFTPGQTGNVKLTVTCTTNSIYVKSVAITTAAPSTDPIISADNVNIAYDATSGEIAYTITNPVTGTSLEASTDANWVSNIVVSTETITFTTTANEASTERVATFTLTYEGAANKTVTVTQAAAPQQYALTVALNDNVSAIFVFDVTNQNEPLIENGAAGTVQVMSGTSILVSPDVAEGYVLATLIVNNENVISQLDDSGAYTFTMPASNVTVTAQWRGSSTYTLVTSTEYIVPGKHYVFASTATNGTARAMASQSSNNRSTVEVSIENSNFAEVSGLHEFVISGDATNKYTIYDATTPGYLYAASRSNNYLRAQTTNDENGQWTIAISEGVATITAQGTNNHNLMQYNSQNKIFSCYSSAQQSVYLYMKDNDTDYEFYSNTNSSATIASTETYTVHSPAILTFTGTNNGTAANLIVEDGAKLYSNNAVQATMQKNITAASNWSTASDGWNFIASPVNTTLSPTAAGLITDNDNTNPTYDLYYLNSEAKWKNYRNATFSLANGQGYLYANKADVTLQFAGETKAYNESNNKVTLAHTGWNLIGNPFPFPVSVGTAFAELNNGSAVTNKEANSVIMPYAGIVVNGNANDQVTFTKAEPTSVAPSNGSLNISVAQANSARGAAATLDNAIVSFNEGSQLGKFYFGEQNASIYIPQGGEEYAIVTVAETSYYGVSTEMPLNFKAKENGTYTLSFAIDNVEMDYLHLIDNMTGADVNLLAPELVEGPATYTFTARTTDYTSRFRLVFKANGIEEDGACTGSADFAFFNGANWTVSHTGEATLQVIDVEGRVLKSETLNGNATVGIDQPAGLYLLRLVSGNDVKTQKIVVR